MEIIEVNLRRCFPVQRKKRRWFITDNFITDNPNFIKELFVAEAETSPDKEAEEAIQDLSFCITDNNPIYTELEGPVFELVRRLKELGWEQSTVKPLLGWETTDNPFLLKHPNSKRIFNYSETNNKPSENIISYWTL